MLSAEKISLAYRTVNGSITALRGFDLEVGRGEFVSVLGPSGCGKSTFLKIASGLLAPSAGRVMLNGDEVVKPRPDVGVVFQQPYLLPWKSVLSNVLVAAEALKLDKAVSKGRAMDFLKLTGLDGFAENYPGELSGGMQQRVGLVRGLVHDPEMLLMDEPFAALDAMTREHMTMELQDLWMRTGKSVMFITHSIPEAVILSDRVVVMSERPGHVVETVNIPFSRPRTLDTMASSEFGEICNHLRQQFAAWSAR